jgi:integrase
VIGAQSEEIKNKVWTVPAGRMKASKEHRVPLSAAALAIIETLRKEQGGAHLFPGGKRDKPLSNMAMLALLDRMGRSDLTTHGLRSTYSSRLNMSWYSLARQLIRRRSLMA